MKSGIRVRVQREPDGGASITVADTGIGIDPGELPRIFDRFFRGSRASEARGSGSGLGLSISKALMDRMSGEIGFESKPGEGTVFYVTLPRANSMGVLPAVAKA